MNLQGNEFVRILCLGILLPVLLFLAVLVMREKDRDKIPQEGSGPTQSSTSAATPQNKMEISVLYGGRQQSMELEDYLIGVVLAEMPASFELEALKAQAVAARTYTIKHCTKDARHGSNTICTDHTCCQAYIDPRDYVSGGGSWSSVERVQQAVSETAGLVLMYGQELIVATYFSCAGGITEDAAAVWGQDYPYLQSVTSPGEEDTVFFTDSKTFTADEFQTALGIRLKGPVGAWFGEVSFTQGGGVEKQVIGGVAYRGTTLRTLLGLRSTAFIVSVADDTITFHTRGYGHRVGMSQYGANAMAKAGKDCQQILTHYYTGTRVVQYFEEIGKNS